MVFPPTNNVIAQYAGPYTMWTRTLLQPMFIELMYSKRGGPVILGQNSVPATVRCSVARKDSHHFTHNPTSSVHDINNGVVEIDWGSFTFSSPGLYELQFVATLPDGTPIPSQKLLLDVQTKVAGL